MRPDLNQPALRQSLEIIVTDWAMGLARAPGVSGSVPQLQERVRPILVRQSPQPQMELAIDPMAPCRIKPAFDIPALVTANVIHGIRPVRTQMPAAR